MKEANVGAGGGVFIGIAMTFLVLGDWPAGELACGVLRYPAVLLASCFHSSLTSDAACATLVVAIVIQWVIVGTIVGLLLSCRRVNLCHR